MTLDRRTLVIIAAVVIAVALAVTLAINIFMGGTEESQAPQSPATPLPSLPAPTAESEAVDPEPAATSEPSAFMMRDAVSGSGAQSVQEGQTPGGGSDAPVVQSGGAQTQPDGGDWSPVFGGPQTAFSAEQSFPGPDGTPAPTPDSFFAEEIVVEEKEVPGDSTDTEEPYDPVVLGVQIQPTVMPQPTGTASVDPPQFESLAHADDLVVLSQGRFGAERSYRANMVLEYRLSYEAGDLYIPIHASVQERRPDRYRAEWALDPFDESPVETVIFHLTKVGDRVYVDGDVDLGGELVYQNIPLEIDLCVLLMCELGKSAFIGANLRPVLDDGSVVEVFARQVRFGAPLEFLNGQEADVVYVIDGRSGLIRSLDLSATVPLDTSLDSGTMDVGLRVNVSYDDVDIVDPEASWTPIPTPVVETQVPVIPTPVVVPTPASVSVLDTSTSSDDGGDGVGVVPTPVAPSVEVIEGEEGSDGVKVRVISHGYEIQFPNDWFTYDSSVFGDLLGGRISDGLRDAFATEHRPHLVALDGFDAMPYVVLSQHAPPPEGQGLDTFSHLEFSRQTERKLLVNRGWAVSLMENLQGYEGRLYRYETTRDTVEWMVFFMREHDVIQVLMEANVNDGEGIDYDRQFRQMVREMRFGASIGDDGSRPLVSIAPGDVSLTGGDPHVVGVSYLGEIISVRFSEPVWPSSWSGVFLRVLRKGAAHCEPQCDGSDTVLDFHLPGLANEDVVDGFIFDSPEGSIRDVDGNAVQHRFTPFTMASYPVVVATDASMSGSEVGPGDIFTVEFSEPVWVAQGDLHLFGSEGRSVMCLDCPVGADGAVRTLSFGWEGGLGVPDDLPRVGDFMFRIDGSGVVLSVDGVIADVVFDPFEIRGR